MKVNAGKAYLETLNFKKSIHFLVSSSLTGENKLLLALAYLKDNQRDKCKQILLEIKNDSAIKTMALDNKNLKPIMQEIINEDKPINEQVKSPDAVSQ